jgi:hypothetical protein
MVFIKSIAERLRFGFGDVQRVRKFRGMACPALPGRGNDHSIMTCKYSCLNFLLHLPGVFGSGLLHYEDGVMG